MNHDQGTNPMTQDTPSIIDGKGKKRVLRRLGIKQLFALAKMIKTAIIWGSMDFQARFKRAMDYDKKEDILYLILMGITEVEEPFLKFFADVMGVSEKDIINPDIFPLGSEIQFLQALSNHPDVQSFFDLMGKKGEGEESPPWMETIKSQLKKTSSEIGNEVSTDSGDDTDSPTDK